VRRAGVEPAQPIGTRVTAAGARQCPADASRESREGFEPLVVHPTCLTTTGLQPAVGITTRFAEPAPRTGFEPATSSLTGRRALQAAPPRRETPCKSRKQVNMVRLPFRHRAGRKREALEGVEPSSPCGHPVTSRNVCMLLPLGHGRQSAQWESNPHFRHGKAAGYRYIMGASQSPSRAPGGD
jgi:hypothetical protein